MSKYIITERLVVHKYYEVEADSVEDARDELTMGTEYTVLDSDTMDAEIIDIEEQG